MASVRAGWLVHLFAAIALGAGLLLPLTDAGQALANPDTSSQQTQTRSQVPGSPAQVVAIGDFQDQLGCGNGDTSCQSSALSSNGGIWTGNFPIAPGSYSVQFAVTSQDGNQFIFGSGGQDGGPIGFSVGDGQLGAFFSYDSHTNDVQAEGVDALYTVQTDVGSFVPTPSGGNLEVLIPSQGGTVNVQLLANGAPVADPQQASLSPGWTRVTLDTAGNVLGAEGLTYGTLTVVRLDADGNSAAGACYQLQGGGLANQGCDSDDGSLDGNTLMTFPDGLNPGDYTLVEAQAPDGQDAVDDQSVSLQPGDNVVQVQPAVGGEDDEPTEEAQPTEEPQATEEDDVPITSDLPPEETEEPTEDIIDDETQESQDQGPGDLIVALLDEDGNPVGGACWQLIQDGNVIAETCDATDNFPLNGVVGFFGVPGGTYTLHQSEVPDGSEQVDDYNVEIVPGEERREEPVTSVAAPEDETGDVVVLRQDNDGNPVGGSCFEILDGNGNAVANQVCDEDGDVADDGRTGFFDVPVGTWTIRETRTPDSVEPAQDTQVTVNAGQATDVPVQSAALVFEEPTEEPTEAPEPTEEPEPTDEPTEAPATGTVVFNLLDQNGNAVGGACFQLIQDGNVIAESCDSNDQNPNNGRTGFFNVPSGTYTLHQSSDLDGFETLDDQEIEIAPNDERTMDLTIQIIEEPTEEPQPTEEPIATEEPEVTEEPIVTEEPEATEEPEPTELPTEQPADAVTGNLQVDLYDPNQTLVGGACWQLIQDGNVVEEACDTEGTEDRFPFNGKVGLYEVPVGAYTLHMSSVPDGFEAVADQDVEIAQGDALLEVTIQPEGAETVEPTEVPTEEPEPTEEPVETEAPEPTEEPEESDLGDPGNLIVTLQDDEGNNIGGACFELGQWQPGDRRLVRFGRQFPRQWPHRILRCAVRHIHPATVDHPAGHRANRTGAGRDPRWRAGGYHGEPG